MTFPRRMFSASMVLSLAAFIASPAGAVDPKLLPGDTEVVVTLNLKQMLDSEVAKQYKELLDQGRAFIEAELEKQKNTNPALKYLEKAGFDLMRDLHSVTVASNGSKDVEAGFLVVEGKFNVAKINTVAEDAARENAELLKVTRMGSVNVIEFTPPGGEKRFYVALINDKTLVATASHDALKDAISGTPRKGLNANFKSLLKTTSSKQSFSFAASGVAIAKMLENAPIPNADAAMGMIKNIDGISAALTLGKDIQFQLGVNSKDEETAKQMVGMGNFGLLAARTAVANKAKEDEKFQPLVDIAKTLRITSEGNNVVLRGEVTLENLEKLIKLAPKGFGQ